MTIGRVKEFKFGAVKNPKAAGAGPVIKTKGLGKSVPFAKGGPVKRMSDVDRRASEETPTHAIGTHETKTVREVRVPPKAAAPKVAPARTPIRPPLSAMTPADRRASEEGSTNMGGSTPYKKGGMVQMSGKKSKNEC